MTLDQEALEDNKTGGYAVAFDPLDGSTVIESNFAVGTIFGIWPGKQLTNIYGRDMAAAGMCCYGPRTTVTLTVNGVPGTHEFMLKPSGKWVRTNNIKTMQDCSTLKKGDKRRIHAPGNVKGLYENPEYGKMIAEW
jgi:sedoheptulose-bisphosphatase